METPPGAWIGAVLDGVVAAVAMAVAMAVLMPGALEQAIPALYGQTGGAFGLTAHLAHGAVLGLVFAAIVRFGGLTEYTDSVTRSALLGAAYGVALWIVTGSFVLPAWLSAVGVPMAVPTFSGASLITHLVYGIVLGALYPWAKRY